MIYSVKPLDLWHWAKFRANPGDIAYYYDPIIDHMFICQYLGPDYTPAYKIVQERTIGEYLQNQEEAKKVVELKPCPFCGGEAELTSKKDSWGQGLCVDDYFVKCTVCECTSKHASDYRKTVTECKTEVVDAWNRRYSK